MRFTSAVVPLLCATLVTSKPFDFLGTSEPSVLDDAFPVPGDNPLTFCGDPATYLIDIDHVDLDPNPPAAGDLLKIDALGALSKDIEPGAKIFLQVKYGLITLINQETDLCDQVGNVNLTCPLKKGEIKISKEVEIPKQVPMGKYTVMADVYTVDKEKATCMQSVVFFPPKKNA